MGVWRIRGRGPLFHTRTYRPQCIHMLKGAPLCVQLGEESSSLSLRSQHFPFRRCSIWVVSVATSKPRHGLIWSQQGRLCSLSVCRIFVSHLETSKYLHTDKKIKKKKMSKFHRSGDINWTSTRGLDWRMKLERDLTGYKTVPVCVTLCISSPRFQNKCMPRPEQDL